MMSILFVLVMILTLASNGASNGASNKALHVHLERGGDCFQQFTKIPIDNVAERNVSISFGIEVTTVQ